MCHLHLRQHTSKFVGRLEVSERKPYFLSSYKFTYRQFDQVKLNFVKFSRENTTAKWFL